MTEWETIAKIVSTICWSFFLVFIISINLFGQLKYWVGHVLCLDSCLKGQVLCLDSCLEGHVLCLDSCLKPLKRPN